MFTAFTSGNRKWWSLAAGGVLVIGAAAWGVTAHLLPAKDPLGLPPELSAANLKAQAANPDTLMQTMHETMQRTDLTDAQREEVMHRMRGVWQARLDQRINEYFAAIAAEEKQAILDRQLDEMQKEMQEREARRAEMEQERAQRDAQRDPNRPHRRDFASMSPQEQKTRAESRNPDAMARRMAYFQALRARAAERGIPMPFGPGGGRGGPPGHGGPH